MPLMDLIRQQLIRFAGRHPRSCRALACLHNLLAGNHRYGVRCQMSDQEAFLKSVTYDIEGRDHQVVIGRQARIENTRVHIRGHGNRLIIDPECYFKSAVLCLDGTGCTMSIGAETTIEDAHLAATEEGTAISIGKDCMFAFGIDVRNGDSHSILDASTGVRLNPARDIRIGDHVWIGAHAQVLKGVTIGEGSVIGIRSVVTHDVPSHVMAAGVPTRVVREGVRWAR